MLKLRFIHQSKQLTLPRLKGYGILGVKLRFLLALTCVLHSHITFVKIQQQALMSVCRTVLKFIIPQFIKGQQIHPHPLKRWTFSAIFAHTATIGNKQIFLQKLMKTSLETLDGHRGSGRFNLCTENYI